MNDWQVRTLAEARTAADRPLLRWPALEDGRCQYHRCNATATHVGTSVRLHMRALLCPPHAETVRLGIDTPPMTAP